ncbi:WD repeat-containing protein 76 [Heracleum sosnowskyi]|uniref:WD repeat-containing protein 76 n=1 Tax=Heracleum sosnowskyi TaxID=360622 RepID=A0AAD8J448_9APIA|nr:WD repeat-containing protein 76 [Heracleum sosnowskyi]
MAPKKLTDYERKRLDNIKRNEEMLAALKIHSKLNDLVSSSKPQRVKSKSYKVSPKKKVRSESPVVIRRSLRSRGIKPDELTAGGLKDNYSESPNKKAKTVELSRELGPIRMRDVCVGEELEDRKFVEAMVDVTKGLRVGSGGGLGGGVKIGGLDSLRLEEGNVARVVPGRILSVRVFPCEERRMVVVGNKYGNVGFWDVDCVDESDGIYVYQPHSAPVSGIVIQPFSLSKMFTCCYDGFIRLMDVEKEIFDLAYSGAYSIYSIAHRPDDGNSLYFSEGRGELNMWDGRTGKSSSSWGLHETKINSIHFNACNTNMMATSSSDGTACIWDLRKVVADKAEALNTVNHEGAVHSAYFSPSGSILATTSLDDSIKLLSGANYENVSKIHHNNHTGRWISTFRGVWGWDDSHVFIGNMKRGVDVISTAEKRCIDTLVSPEMTAIPCRFDVHPHKFGMLAGATSGGQVYLWTSSC